MMGCWLLRMQIRFLCIIHDFSYCSLSDFLFFRRVGPLMALLLLEYVMFASNMADVKFLFGTSLIARLLCFQSKLHYK
jgi:hypothetical protein